MKMFKKGQGATEYLLMLAAVLVIVAIAVYYVTSTGGYPAVTAAAQDENENIKITVSTGSVATGDWAYSVSTAAGTYSWVTGAEALDAPYVVIANDLADGSIRYVSLKHIPSGHYYITDTKVEITY